MLFGFEDSDAIETERVPQREPTPTNEDRGSSGYLSAQAPPAVRGPSTWVYTALGVCAGLAIACAVWAMWPNDEPGLTQSDVADAVDDALAARRADPPVGQLAYEQVAPSLVVVRAIHGDGSDENPETPNLGSGIVVNNQGQILTANHVVAGAQRIELTFADGTTSMARLDANETELDIAVLRASSPGALVPAVLGNSRTVQIGDPIFVVGNPLGLTGTLSAGVISGTNRNIPFPGDGDLVLENLIQFDAAVNQGSSGGPLLNADGQVIGIVTALADPAGQGFFIGVGFALPIDIAAGGAVDGPSQ